MPQVALGVPFLFATGYGEGRDTGGHADARVLRRPFARRALVDAVAALKRNSRTPPLRATCSNPSGSARWSCRTGSPWRRSPAAAPARKGCRGS